MPETVGLPLRVTDVGGARIFPMVATRQVARGIKLFEIRAPRIAKKQRPGQFVIVHLYDTGERVALT